MDPSGPNIRRRRWFQFRLRTLLLLVTASAVASAWWLRPSPRQSLLADGWLIRREWTRASAEDRDSPIDVQWQLSTAEGQRLARGRDREDAPHGRFLCYHADGRLGLEGVCSRGEPIGTWQSWFPQGTRRSQWQCVSADRSGESEVVLRVWYPTGAVRLHGTLRSGREQGLWNYFNADGLTTASGSYCRGRRHGWWTYTDPTTRVRQEIYHAHGLPLPEIHRLVVHLTDRLRAEEPAVRIAAIRSLEQLGPIGVQPLVASLDQADERTAVLVLRTLGQMRSDAASALPVIARHRDADCSLVRFHARLASFLIDAGNRSRERSSLLAAIRELEPFAALDAMARIFSADSESHPVLVRQVTSLMDVNEGRGALLVQLGARPASVLPLLEAALDDPDTVVRARVLDLMIAYRDEAALLGWTSSDHRVTLMSLLEKTMADPDPMLRARAEQLLEVQSSSDRTSGMGGMF